MAGEWSHMRGFEEYSAQLEACDYVASVYFPSLGQTKQQAYDLGVEMHHACCESDAERFAEQWEQNTADHDSEAWPLDSVQIMVVIREDGSDLGTFKVHRDEACIYHAERIG